MKLSELARLLDAEMTGPGDVEITGVAGLREAGQGQITYIESEKYLKELDSTKASAVIVPKSLPGPGMPALRVSNARFAFSKAIGIFHGESYSPIGISDRAVIGKGAAIGHDPSIHPYAVVDERARIGHRVTLYPGVYIGKGSVIGDDCLIYPGVCIRERVTIGNRVIIHAGTVIGSDGFGFVTEGGKHHKIPQIGGVIIHDDVEIGANCAIDRAAMGNTIVGKGTKIDNHVHIAHNVIIGDHCLLAGQVGIAGSATIGNYVVFGGQVGIADHITIGDGVMVGGGSAIIKDTAPGQVLAGYYALPVKEWLRVQALLPKLPELKKAVAELQNKIRELQQNKGDKS